MKSLKTGYNCIAYADSRQGGRAENQDSCAWGDTPFGFLVTVCDGMGGGPSGKMASMIAVTKILEYVKEADTDGADRKTVLTEAIFSANDAILAEEEADPSKKGMGTTVTALLINDYSAIIAHVGDSRVYQFRRKAKCFRTDDHSLVFEQVRNGELKNEEEARLSPDSNIILRALGISKNVQPEVVERAYEKGDRFMLCSDGIWGMFPEKKIISIAAGTASLPGAVESLVVKVDEEGFAEGGGHDNLTVALVETKNNSIVKEKMSTKQIRTFLILGVVCLASIILNVVLLSKYIPEHKKYEVDQLQRDSLIEKIVDEKMVQMDKKYKDLVDQLNQNMGQEEKTKELLDKATQEISLKDDIDRLIQSVEALNAMKAGKDKDDAVERVKTHFETIVKNGGPSISKEDVAKIREWLTNKIAKWDTPESNNHRNSIIKRLKQIKERI